MAYSFASRACLYRKVSIDVTLSNEQPIDQLHRPKNAVILISETVQVMNRECSADSIMYYIRFIIHCHT